jgi:predicted esterase
MNASELGFQHRFVSAQVPDQPTLLLLHGTGGDETDLLPLGDLLAPGAALLSPLGKVSEGGMARFFRRLAEGVFDMDDLRLRTHELADFVAKAAEVYGFDPQRVIAVGFSNGANIAASMMLLRPEVLAASALFSPMYPFTPERLPELSGCSVFIGAGRLDPLASPDHPERLAELLRNAGAGVTLNWHPGGHALTPSEVRAAAEWLREKHLVSADAEASSEIR